MAEVSIEIGGRRYEVACRDGEEQHLRNLARMVDAKAAEAKAAVGGVNEARQLLFAALLLADQLHEARSGLPPAPSDAADEAFAAAVERLAARAEDVAARLEGGTPSA